MSQRFEGSETHPPAFQVMGRFSELAGLSPQTSPRDALVVFYAAGNIVTSLLGQMPTMDPSTASFFLHNMTFMYGNLLDTRLGFQASDDQVRKINRDADQLIANLRNQTGRFSSPLQLTYGCFEQYFKTLHPGIETHDLNVRLAALIDIAVDGVRAAHDPSAYLKLVSNDILVGSAKFLGFDPGSEQAQNLRLLAAPQAQAFMQDN